MRIKLLIIAYFNGEGKHREETCISEISIKMFSKICEVYQPALGRSVVDYGLNLLIMRGGPCPAVGQFLNRADIIIRPIAHLFLKCINIKRT